MITIIRKQFMPTYGKYDKCRYCNGTGRVQNVWTGHKVFVCVNCDGRGYVSQKTMTAGDYLDYQKLIGGE